MSQISVYSSGSTPPPVEGIQTITGNTGGAVGPDGSDNINIVGGNDISIVGNPGSNTLTASITGTTNHAIQVGNASGSLTSLAAATNGQIPIGSTGADPVVATLTQGSGITITNGPGSITIAATGGGSGITQIDGDTGVSATDSTVIFTGVDAGGSVTFNGDNAGQISLQSTDSDFNTIYGLGSLVPTTGVGNNFFGSSAGSLGIGTCTANNGLGNAIFTALETGSYNTCIGDGTFGNLTTGSYNIAVGAGSGNFATGSNNIWLNHSSGVDESNTLRIGAGTGTDIQQLDTAYIYGIDGVDLNTAEVVTMASDQLGSATLTPGSGITITPGAGVITIAATGSSTAVAFSANVSTTLTNVTGDGTLYYIVFDNVLFDTGSNYDNTTGIFTAPSDGIYCFSTTVYVTNLEVTSSLLAMKIQTTTKDYNAPWISPFTISVGTEITQSAYCVTQMTAGDICIFSILVGGVNKTVSLYGDGNAGLYTYCSGYKIG